MDRRHRLALAIVGSAFGLGLLGNFLLRDVRPGVNVALWLAALVGTGLLLSRKVKEEIRPVTPWLAVPVLFFGAALAIHDSVGTSTLAFLGVALCLTFLASFLRHVDLRDLTLFQGTVGAACNWVLVMADAFLLFVEDIEWKLLGNNRWAAAAKPYARGALISVPVLLLFGALLTSADAVFNGMVDRAFTFRFDTLAADAWFVALFGVLAFVFLRRALLSKREQSILDTPPPRASQEGSTEALVVLGALNLLFVLFVAVQFRAFFGGAEFVRQQVGLSFAEYARRGFFELVWVSGLALPVLIGFGSLAKRGGPAKSRVFVALGATMIGLLFVIMGSALQRMNLYVSAHGLSELRVYATALMAWLALVYGVFAATVLRHQPRRFVFGSFVSGLAVGAVLIAISPGRMIAEQHVSLFRRGQPLDVGYLQTLGADAVPSLTNVLSELPKGQATNVADWLQEFDSPGDWRSYNWSRERARRAVNGKRAEIAALATPGRSVASRH